MRKTLSVILLTAGLSLCQALPMVAQSVRVKVKTPGTLAERIKAKSKDAITSLKISGTLNAEDIRTLRYLCGRDTLGNETPGRISHVDLREVSFVPGGRPYFYADRNYSVRSAHSLPDCLFDKCNNLESVILPERTDTIGMYSFAHTALREVRVPDNCMVRIHAFYNCRQLTQIELGRMPHTDFMFSDAFAQCNAIRRVRLHDIDYVGGGSFCNMPHLEAVDFRGTVGHIDGYVFSGNPRLKAIRFLGNVINTGGTQFVADCPSLTSVEFCGVVFNTYFGAGINTPQFKAYTVSGVVLNSGVEADLPSSTTAQRAAYKDWETSIKQSWEWVERCLQSNNIFMIRVAWNSSEAILKAAREQGLTEMADRISKKRSHLNTDGGKTYLEILRESAPYVAENERSDLPAFKYADMSDSLLQRTRRYFNTDSIAGNGDDVSRIKNLLAWVHNNIRHDGSSKWPNCHINAVDLYETCQRENRPLNCRFMAIVLNEMLLSVGIPARYIGCQSKHYATDSDSHIICIAWSESLGKWIWVDPTWEAYVTDEHGTLLHPGEVRERLQKGQPLVVNENANWNHKNRTSTEEYLENYMAKNLYIISSFATSQSQAEGPGENPRTPMITLIPQGFEYGGLTTTDDKYFWQAPH